MLPIAFAEHKNRAKNDREAKFERLGVGQGSNAIKGKKGCNANNLKQLK